MPRLPKRYYWDKHINLRLKYFYVFVTIGTGTFVMTHRKAWEQQMIYLMMIDAEEDKQKFAILYETYDESSSECAEGYFSCGRCRT